MIRVFGQKAKVFWQYPGFEQKAKVFSQYYDPAFFTEGKAILAIL